MAVIALMIRQAKKADQKSLTSSALLQRAVSESIIALTTNTKRPSVRKVIGKVRTLRIPPIIALMTPKRSATQR
jgi:hypothetical protein